MGSVMVSSTTGSKFRRSFDWRSAARLWAAGVEPEAIAAAMGIEENYFWNHLARSARFRRFVDIAVYGSRGGRG